MKDMIRKIGKLNWNVYQRLKPLLLIVVSFLALMSLFQFGWKFIIQILVITWALILATYEFLKEFSK